MDTFDFSATRYRCCWCGEQLQHVPQQAGQAGACATCGGPLVAPDRPGAVAEAGPFQTDQQQIAHRLRLIELLQQRATSAAEKTATRCGWLLALAVIALIAGGLIVLCSGVLTDLPR